MTKKFITKKGLGKYISNPFSSDYILSIPEIQKIDDTKSFEEAMNNLQLGYMYSTDSYFFSCQRSLGVDTIIFKEDTNNSTFSITKESTHPSINGNNIENAETRTYSIENGIEIERDIKNQGLRSILFKRTELRIVEKFYSNSPTLLGDLTTSKEDVGTLDEADNFKSYLPETKDKDEEGYKERLEQKIKDSKNPNGCRKFIQINSEKEK